MPPYLLHPLPNRTHELQRGERSLLRGCTLLRHLHCSLYDGSRQSRLDCHSLVRLCEAERHQDLRHRALNSRDGVPVPNVSNNNVHEVVRASDDGGGRRGEIVVGGGGREGALKDVEGGELSGRVGGGEVELDDVESIREGSDRGRGGGGGGRKGGGIFIRLGFGGGG